MTGIGEWGAAEETAVLPNVLTQEAKKAEGTVGGDGSDREVYVCDLSPRILEHELRMMLGRYGEITNLERVLGDVNGLTAAVDGDAERDESEAAEAAVLCEYATREAAVEAIDMLNHSLVRGRSIRCLFVSDLEVMRQTMQDGRQRLVVMDLDGAIESRGLLDVAALFGHVLDCKVELSTGTGGNSADGAAAERQLRVGFVHYAQAEAANKALTFLDGMQIGESVVKVRPFTAKDVDLFTGCLYAAGCFDQQAQEAPEVYAEQHQDLAPGNAVQPSVAGHPPEPMHERADQADQAGFNVELADVPVAKAVLPKHIQAAYEEASEHFRALRYHYLEVLDDRGSKLKRLRSLIELYSPNHEQQMFISARPDSLDDISGILRDTCDAYDFEVITAMTSAHDRRGIVNDYTTGNIYVLLVSETILFGREALDAVVPAAVLVMFDLPKTLSEYLYGILRETRPNTSRVHGLLMPATDTALCEPLLGVLEEAGHEIDPKLIALWGRVSARG